MSTVYVVQNQMRRGENGLLQSAFDLAPAREYGRIEFLLPSGPVPLEPDTQIKLLNEKLQHFDASEDYLLPVGNPVTIAAASAIVAHNTGGVVPLLVWDRMVRRYNAVRVAIFGEEK